MAARGKANGTYQGMNWIRPEKRLGLYLRDGLACVYCGATIEDGVRLTLDHLIPYSHGGKNGTENLITCCLRCNSSRSSRPVEEFAQVVAEYLNHGVTPADILAHIRACIARPIQTVHARELIGRRGGFTKALKS